jgi:hypothetical protein
MAQPSPGPPHHGGPSLQDLSADLVQRVLLRLPDVSAAAAAARFLCAAVTPAFRVEWFLARHAAAAPDRPWQYAAIAAWPRARAGASEAPAGGGGAPAAPGAASAAAAAARTRDIAAFLRAALLRRAELGLHDQSGPGSSPQEAATAAARVQQLLAEHDALAAGGAAGGSGASGSGSDAGASGSGGGVKRQEGGQADGAGSGGAPAPAAAAEASAAVAPAARALMLLCPHAEHLLVPYLALGDHAGALSLLLPLLEGPSPRVLPWLAQGKAPAPEHDMLLSGNAAAERRGARRRGRPAAAGRLVIGVRRRCRGTTVRCRGRAGGGRQGSSGPSTSAALEIAPQPLPLDQHLRPLQRSLQQ